MSKESKGLKKSIKKLAKFLAELNGEVPIPLNDLDILSSLFGIKFEQTNPEPVEPLEKCPINFLNLHEDVNKFIKGNIGRKINIDYVTANVSVSMIYPLDTKGIRRTMDIIDDKENVVQNLYVVSNDRL